MGEGAKGPTQSFVMRFTKNGHIVTLHLPAREAYSGQPRGLFWTTERRTSPDNDRHLISISHVLPARPSICPCTPELPGQPCFIDMPSPPPLQWRTPRERLRHLTRPLQKPAQGGWHRGAYGKPGKTAALLGRKRHGGMLPQEGCSVSRAGHTSHNQDPMACS